MKKIIGILFFALMFSNLMNANATEILLAGTNISCTLSNQLMEVPEDQLINMKMKPLAAYVTGDRSARVTVTLGVHPEKISLKDLDKVKIVMEKGLGSMFSNADWAASELVVVNGRPWIHLDFSAEIQGQRTHSIMFVTAYTGGQLQFLFQSNLDLVKNENEFFSECIKTLTVKDWTK